MKPYHSIFREKALEEYRQRQIKDVLPRFIPAHIFILLYAILLLFLLGGLAALWRDVPVVIPGSGVVLSEDASAHLAQSRQMVIVLFLPAKYASRIHPGAHAQVAIELARKNLTGTIKQVKSGVISPDEAQKRYMLTNTVAQDITPSAIAVTVVPAAGSVLPSYAGDAVSAQVQIGSQKILLLLLGR